MTFEIRVVSVNGNCHHCNLVKGYRKDINKCINAAQNFISELTDKNLCAVNVTILDNGKKVYGWNYNPTMR